MPLKTSGCCCKCTVNLVPVPACAGQLTKKKALITIAFSGGGSGLPNGTYIGTYCGKYETTDFCELRWLYYESATRAVVGTVIFKKISGVWHTLVNGYYFDVFHSFTDCTFTTVATTAVDLGTITSSGSTDYVCDEVTETFGFDIFSPGSGAVKLYT